MKNRPLSYSFGNGFEALCYRGVTEIGALGRFNRANLLQGRKPRQPFVVGGNFRWANWFPPAQSAVSIVAFWCVSSITISKAIVDLVYENSPVVETSFERPLGEQVFYDLDKIFTFISLQLHLKRYNLIQSPSDKMVLMTNENRFNLTAGAIPADQPRGWQTEKEVAQQLHLSIETLRKWRVLGKGPAYCKVGSLVRYSQSAIQSWLEARMKGGEQN